MKRNRKAVISSADLIAKLYGELERNRLMDWLDFSWRNDIFGRRSRQRPPWSWSLPGEKR